MEKLECCPFCGGDAGTWENETWGSFKAGCSNTLCEFSTPWMETIDEAESMWNSWMAASREAEGETEPVFAENDV